MSKYTVREQRKQRIIKKQFAHLKKKGYRYLPVINERGKNMNTIVTKVPYVAIAVKDMHKAADFFANTFGGEILSKGTVEEELYLDCMVKIGDFCLYLMEPMSEES